MAIISCQHQSIKATKSGGKFYFFSQTWTMNKYSASDWKTTIKNLQGNWYARGSCLSLNFINELRLTDSVDMKCRPAQMTSPQTSILVSTTSLQLTTKWLGFICTFGLIHFPFNGSQIRTYRLDNGSMLFDGEKNHDIYRDRDV